MRLSKTPKGVSFAETAGRSELAMRIPVVTNTQTNINPEAGCLYLGRGKTMDMQDLLRWVLWNHLRGSLLGSDRYHG